MKKSAVFLVVLFILSFCVVFAKQETQMLNAEKSAAVAVGSCWISEVPAGSPVSILSQSESGKESLSWLTYSGVVSGSVKFSVKYPGSSRQDKEVQKLSDPVGFFSASVPFSYPYEEFDIDQGSAIYKVKLDSGSCSYPFVFVDNGFESGDIPDDIPDAVNFVDSVISVKNINTIQRVRVSLNLQHTFTNDLLIYLIGPDFTAVELSSANGFSGDNYGAGFFHTQRTVFDDFASTPITVGVPPYVGSFIPEQPLSAFNGRTGTAANGLWRLRVYDVVGQDVGQILNWALIVDDVDSPPFTWSSRLTKETLLDAGYVPDATMEAKLLNTFYSLDSIMNGLTDRLTDGATCTGCHTGDPNTQGPNRYVPVYPVFPDRTNYQDRSLSTTYSWNDPTLIDQFKNTPNTSKPAALKALFQKWLDDGAKQF